MIELRVLPDAAAEVLTQIKLMALRFPGDHDLRLLVASKALVLGPEYRYDASPACLAALSEFGVVVNIRPCVG